jgi:hypothetical protein
MTSVLVGSVTLPVLAVKITAVNVTIA